MAERLKDSLLSTKEDIVDIVAGPDAYRDLPRLLAITQYSDQKAINVMLSLEVGYSVILKLDFVNYQLFSMIHKYLQGDLR